MVLTYNVSLKGGACMYTLKISFGVGKLVPKLEPPQVPSPEAEESEPLAVGLAKGGAVSPPPPRGCQTSGGSPPPPPPTLPPYMLTDLHLLKNP
ncbi:hypothetical protein Hdeb2414_s0002g00082241 [Helianthus debilis subsp. tardiflorus]